MWLAPEVLTVEYVGEPLARYEVEYSPQTKNLGKVKEPRLFETSHRLSSSQPRLFELVTLGENGWLKALKLRGYAPKLRKENRGLQSSLFSYLEAM